jgi:hypothetical protein
MIELNKKTIVIIVILVVVIAGVAVAAKSFKKKEPVQPKKIPVEVTMTIGPETGWIASPDSSGGGATEATLTAPFEGELQSMSINVTIRDTDAEHSQTDEGSDPDSATIIVGDTVFEVSTEPSSGEGQVMQELTKADLSSFNDSIEIQIMGNEFGDGVHPTGPGGIIPIIFLQYIDQGLEYEVEFTYVYIDVLGDGKKNKDKEPAEEEEEGGIMGLDDLIGVDWP